MARQPALEPGQFAVTEVDPRTGIVLDRDGRWALGAESREVFASLEAADAACRERLRARAAGEWWIHDHEGTPMRRISDPRHEHVAPVAGCGRIWQRLLRRLGLRR